jgi:hypothetical protein
VLKSEPLNNLTCAFDVTIGLASIEGADTRTR